MAEDMPEEQIELDPVVVVARITTLEMLVRQMMVCSCACWPMPAI